MLSTIVRVVGVCVPSSSTFLTSHDKGGINNYQLFIKLVTSVCVCGGGGGGELERTVDY